MAKARTRFPLYPFALARDFVVGEPLNGQDIPHEGPVAECRNPMLDYSGGDPSIQFPVGWHVKAGFGNKSGAFHQDTNRFEPHRVKVLPDPKRPHTPRNLIRMEGGNGVNGGSAEVSKWFEREVMWPSGHGVLAEVNVKPTDEIRARMYFNIELRGLLSFQAHKAESVVAFGLHFSGDTLKAKYWLDPYDGITANKRFETKTLHSLHLNSWYRLRLLMTPIQPQYTWRVDAELFQTPAGKVWELHTSEKDSPNGIKFISQITFGDEQEQIASGGVWYVSRAMSWELR